MPIRLRQARDGYVRSSENTHPSRDRRALEAMEGMVIALLNRRRFDDAERMARGLLELREDLHGKHHPDALQTATDLAIILLQQGKNWEADRIHETYEEGYDKVLERGEEVREEIEEGIAELQLGE